MRGRKISAEALSRVAMSRAWLMHDLSGGNYERGIDDRVPSRRRAAYDGVEGTSAHPAVVRCSRAVAHRGRAGPEAVWVHGVVSDRMGHAADWGSDLASTRQGPRHRRSPRMPRHD